MMTLAEAFRAEGYREGYQEVQNEIRQKIARNLLAVGESVDNVAACCYCFAASKSIVSLKKEISATFG
jgi:hypothetical protein